MVYNNSAGFVKHDFSILKPRDKSSIWNVVHFDGIYTYLKGVALRGGGEKSSFRADYYFTLIRLRSRIELNSQWCDKRDRKVYEYSEKKGAFAFRNRRKGSNGLMVCEKDHTGTGRRIILTCQLGQGYRHEYVNSFHNPFTLIEVVLLPFATAVLYTQW